MRFAPRLALLPLLLSCALGSAEPITGASTVLAVLETTDLHATVLSYDYYKLKPEPAMGLERTATLIHQARRDFPNALLLDNGDAIQGSALADYQALVAPVGCEQELAIYKALDALGVEGGGVGNHEFNYGLPYLNQVTGSHFLVDGVDPAAPRCAGPKYPLVLANIVSVRSGQPLFAPYRILEKRVSVTAPDGTPGSATLKIGIIGFTPPAVLGWDKQWLAGKVRAEGVRETAQRYIPEMRAQGADLVIAISHGGLDGATYTPAMENAAYYLAQVLGIDALLLGHTHQVFPAASSALPEFNLPGVDKVRGTVHGVPAVMAGMWGKQLGVIGLHLHYDGHHWNVDKAATTVEVRSIQNPDRSFVATDPAIAPLVEAEHEAAIRYVQTPLGSSNYRMTTYFADVGDVSAVQPVNQAQTAYVQRYVKANLPRYAALPVLSMASPFKSGAGGVADYTDVKPGQLALNNAADLYLYPNALYAVKVNGAELKAWLEKSAERFNRIDPALDKPQELVNPTVPGFNFDMPTTPDLRYLIDITQPAGQRIVGLRYKGRPVSPKREFVVATNSFRASGGGNFPGMDGSRTILASPDASRDVLISYIKSAGGLTRKANGAGRSWQFAAVRTAGPVVFHSAPGTLPLAQEAGIFNVALLKEDDGGGKGFALYALDLAAPAGGKGAR